MYNLFMPDDEKEIEIVLVSCPRCPRKFRTLAPIAQNEKPSCPDCQVPMQIIRAASA